MAIMANLYADEQFPIPVVKFLRNFGHNVLTTQEAGQANQGIPDEEVLKYPINGRDQKPGFFPISLVCHREIPQKPGFFTIFVDYIA